MTSVRLAGSPDKIAFLKGTMNIVDCLAIAPYYVTLFLFPDLFSRPNFFFLILEITDSLNLLSSFSVHLKSPKY